jgi:hypothetical protein
MRLAPGGGWTGNGTSAKKGTARSTVLKDTLKANDIFGSFPAASLICAPSARADLVEFFGLERQSFRSVCLP